MIASPSIRPSASAARPYRTAVTRTVAWLEPLADDAEHPHIALTLLPFRLGRARAADGVLHSLQVSRLHAEIYDLDTLYCIRDLTSANGTYVNGKRIHDTVLNDGDIVALACREFRFRVGPAVLEEGLVDTNSLVKGEALSTVVCRPLLEEMVNRRAVTALFQPIVDLSQGKLLGYEALGRGAHEELSSRPVDLFALADRCKMSATLSRLFRAVAVEQAFPLAPFQLLFCNAHAAELNDPQFVDTLAEAARLLPQGSIPVLEVHEDTVTELEPLRELRRRLQQVGVQLAFDDFGAGQSRLTELAEVTPDFGKLNMSLIRGLDCSTPRQRLVKAIVQGVHDLGSRIIAEGIETVEEAAICRELACDYAQGYFFGHPRSAKPKDVEPETFKFDDLL